MLSPRRVKFRKTAARPHVRCRPPRAHTIALVSLHCRPENMCWINIRQIREQRRAMTATSRRGARSGSGSSRQNRSRMRPAGNTDGLRKGNPEFWCRDQTRVASSLRWVDLSHPKATPSQAMRLAQYKRRQNQVSRPSRMATELADSARSEPILDAVPAGGLLTCPS